MPDDGYPTRGMVMAETFDHANSCWRLRHVCLVAFFKGETSVFFEIHQPKMNQVEFCHSIHFFKLPKCHLQVIFLKFDIQKNDALEKGNSLKIQGFSWILN